MRINWLRTIKAFDGPELPVEVMELDESGLSAADRAVRDARGRHGDPRARPGDRHRLPARRARRRVRRATARCRSSTVADDRVPRRVRRRRHGAERAHGHGRRGPRQEGRPHIDALAARARAASARRSTTLATFDKLQPLVLRRRRTPAAARARAPSERVAGLRARWSAASRPGGDVRGAAAACRAATASSATAASAPARRTRSSSSAPGTGYRFDYDRCTGCAGCYEQCPVHAIEMFPEPRLRCARRSTATRPRPRSPTGSTRSAAIYPITPSSPMAELADEWASRGRTEHLGHGPRGGRDAERGRRGRARCTARCRAAR